MAGEQDTPVQEAPQAGAGDAPAAAPEPTPAENTEQNPAPAEAGAGEQAKADGDKPEASLLEEAEGEDGKSPDEADGQADAKKDGAPETYAAFTLPDDQQLDEAVLAEATPIFKEFNLDQDQAQKLVSLHAKTVSGAVAQALDKQTQDYNNLVKEWTDATKKHPEFGGDNLAKSKGFVKAAIQEYSGSPEEAAELTNLMNEWKLGNNPLLFGLLARAGAKLSEDTLEHGQGAPQTRAKSMAERIYPNMPGDKQ